MTAILSNSGISPPIDNIVLPGSSGPSPATRSASSPPISVVPTPTADLDYPEDTQPLVESESKHSASPPPSSDASVLPNGIHISTDKLDSVSTRPQISTPLDPASIPIHPPHGTPPPPTGQLLEDVMMAEQAPTDSDAKAEFDQEVDIHMDEPLNGVNGHSSALNGSHSPLPTSASAPAFPASPERSGNSMSTSNTVSFPITSDHSEDQPPPAKRARKLSNAELESTPTLNGSSSSSAPRMSVAQHKYCTSTIRSLKKLKDAVPFLHPVDPVALNIPHYPSIIKNPMDFSTVERKLAASNPSKPVLSPDVPKYLTVDDFVADVRLIFQNTITFNTAEHVVSQMGKRVESVFDKQLKQMPPNEEPKPVVVPKPAPPPPPPAVVAPPPPKKPTARRSSTSVPTIRRSDIPEGGPSRPKREIHPPPPKDLPYADIPKKGRLAKAGRKNDGTAEQLKYCSKILADLFKKQYYNVAYPFYEPVDHVKLDLPSYPRIIKKPMDMSTMKRKLDTREYHSASKFYEDFKLMISNCAKFNPPGTPVHNAGVALDRLFEEKWESLPPLRNVSDDDDDEEEESDDDQMRAIALVEAQLEAMRGNLAALKGKKPKDKSKKKEKLNGHVQSSASASSRLPGSAAAKAAKANGKNGKKKHRDDGDSVLSFDQKKALSETIQNLDGAKLERVIQIIHEGVPEIRDSTEEIELDIDSLPSTVLQKLYNFVLKPPPKPKARKSTAVATGGLKRKSMDEEAEAERIRQLEEKMRLFEGGPAAYAAATAAEESHSSDSSSGSDSSGSDSE